MMFKYAGATIVLLAIVAGGWGMSAWQSSDSEVEVGTETEASTETPGELVLEPSGRSVTSEMIASSAPLPSTHTEEYRNERYGFSYWNTPGATITEYDEGGGAMTIVHENLEKVRGMPIFIVPYHESTISE